MSAGLAPVLRVARRCMASSSSCPSAAMSATTSIERSRRERPGPLQTLPQAPSAMKRWKSASSAVVRAVARSTWASPGTARRTFMPRS